MYALFQLTTATLGQLRSYTQAIIGYSNSSQYCNINSYIAIAKLLTILTHNSTVLLESYPFKILHKAVLRRCFMDRQIAISVAISIVISSVYVVAVTFFVHLTIRMKFLRMRDKCKVINVQQNLKHLCYKNHGLFVRTYITFQQSYLSQIKMRQTSFEECFDSNRRSRDCRAL